MNKEINQKISQFLDDELDHTELDGFLHSINNKPELKNKISRYQVATQVLKAEQSVLIQADFLEKVNQQIQQEPHYFLPAQKKRIRHSKAWQRSSLAVAATFACVAVILSQQNALQPAGQAQQIAAAPATVEKPVIVVANKPRVSQHERLKAYLQAHNDDLYTHGSLNIHPLARVASYGQD